MANSDGTECLNLTQLGKSFQGYKAPVDLALASTNSTLRAEYFAATIVAALDLKGSIQPHLSSLLAELYELDCSARDSSEETMNARRKELCQQARTLIATSLPQQSIARFQGTLQSDNFLFETMSLTAASIEYGASSGTMTAKGNARFAIGADGALHITADSTSFDSSSTSRLRTLPR